MQDYTSFYKEWVAPQPLFRTLCPYDPSEEKEQSAEDNEALESEAVGGASTQSDSSHREDVSRLQRGMRMRDMPNVRTMNINGRRVLMCNLNGNYFQVLC